MRDPEPCRTKHTEDTEQQTGWCLFFINSADGYKASSSSRLFVLLLENYLELCSNIAKSFNNKGHFCKLGTFFNKIIMLDNCVVDQTYLIVLPIETWDLYL